MIQPLLDKILAQTYTQTDALNRLHALKNLLVAELFGRGKSSDRQTAPVSLGKDFYKHFNRNNVYNLFDTLEEKIREIKPLVIFLPFELPEEGMAALGQRMRRLFGKNFLAEIKLDPNLLAGAALVWDGVYKDFSLREKIEDNRERIIKTLREGMKR